MARGIEARNEYGSVRTKTVMMTEAATIKSDLSICQASGISNVQQQRSEKNQQISDGVLWMEIQDWFADLIDVISCLLNL